jgi:CRISPR system Cascade subunit CasA
MHLVARTVTRGQGKTEGYHESAIPIRKKATGMLRSSAGQANLHNTAKERVDIIGESHSILGHAVKTYLQNGRSDGKTRKGHQDVINIARGRLEQMADQDFWTHLQDEIESQYPDQTRAEWTHNTLIPQARSVLESICRSGLCRETDRYKATTQALDLFDRRTATSKKLPAKPAEKEEPAG